MLRVLIDQDKCCGAGTCVRTAPEVFDQGDEDGLVILLDVHPPAELHPAVHEAADLCPAGAIQTEDVSDTHPADQAVAEEATER